jgi:hypothetical protein
METQVKLIKEFLWMLLISALLFCCGKASAQVLPEYSAFPDASIGVQLGTQGLGVQGTYSFARLFNVRAGFNSMFGNWDYKNRDLSFDRNSFYAIGDWQPQYGGTSWLARKWFISAGAAYYFNNSVYREGIGKTPDYTIYMAKFRPYIGTGLGNIRLGDKLGLRLDMGYFIPLTAPTSTDPVKADKAGFLPGLNTAATVYIKF